MRGSLWIMCFYKAAKEAREANRDLVDSREIDEMVLKLSRLPIDELQQFIIENS